MWTMLIILFCIFLNALLAGIEIAYVSVNKNLVRKHANEGNQDAKKLLALKEIPENTLSTIQIGITLVGSLSAAVGGFAAGQQLTPFFLQTLKMNYVIAEILVIFFVVIPLTYLTVVVGEITPKALVIRNPYYFASRGAGALSLLSKLLYPFVRICEISTKWILNLPFIQRFRKKERQGMEAEQEKVFKDFPTLPRRSREYVINLFNIQEKTMDEILLKWDKVDYVTSEQSLKEIEKKIIASGHTRMPVMQDQKVIGLINTKEILALSKSKETRWTKLIHSPLCFPNTTPPLQALRILQERNSHMGIVGDPEEPIGIITIEDIIEEILGEIYDEDDEGSLERILKF